jgi:metallophosphoesterase (TIGR00282 family)
MVMSIRILFLGEIVGRPGIHALKGGLKPLKESHGIDFVVANGEGATNGYGLGKNHALQILKLGVGLLMTGEKTYYKKDMVEYIAKNPRIMRPANYPPGTPGRGYRIFEIKGQNVAFINLLGNANFPRTHLANPYHMANVLIDKLKEETPIICLQFHATTTAEKQTMAYHVKARSATMVGTHSKVLTSDARIIDGQTAIITDIGMCGSTAGVGGFKADTEIERFLTQVPSRAEESWGKIELQGVVIDVDDAGKATNIELIRNKVASPEEQTAS